MTYLEGKPGYSVPGPSREAAEEVEMRAKSRSECILSVLKEHPTGLTVFEVARLTNLGHWQVSPRLAEMHSRGLIEQTGERKRGQSRVKVNCWRAVATNE